MVPLPCPCFELVEVSAHSNCPAVETSLATEEKAAAAATACCRTFPIQPEAPLQGVPFSQYLAVLYTRGIL